MPAPTFAPLPASVRRICVVGVTGSGKSTLAAGLSRRLHIPHIELDALYWQPGWQELDREEMRRCVDTASQADAWVADGNYSFLQDLLWRRAQALVWLDYPLPFTLWRLWWRTWRRVLAQEHLWGTNRESLAVQFFSRDSLFRYAFTSRRKQRASYAEALARPEYAHLTVYRFRSPRIARQWLGGLEAGLNPFPGTG